MTYKPQVLRSKSESQPNRRFREAKASGRSKSYLARLGRPSSVIGIDIGASSVKAAQVVESMMGLSLHKIACSEIFSVEEKDRPAAVVRALKEALSGMDTRKAKIVSVVSCPKTFTRNLITPLMPRQELAEAVRWEAKNSVPFPLEEAVWDFAVTGEVADQGVKKLSIMLAASPQETVENLLSVFSQGGLEVASLIPVSEAVRSLLASALGGQITDSAKHNAVPTGPLRSEASRQGEETVAVVEMGASMTELNIYRRAPLGGAHLVFSRKLSVSARNITEALRSTLVSEQGKVDLSLDEAEEIKRKWGLPDIESDETEGRYAEPAVTAKPMIDGKISMSQVLSLIRPEVEQLAGDIGGSMDFYKEESRGGRVDKILLFGGGAALKGLAAFLKGDLGVEVSVGDAFGAFKIPAAPAGRQAADAGDETEGRYAEPAVAAEPTEGSAKQKASYLFGLAIGAAMHGAKSANFTEEKNINLLPLELKEKTRRFIENVSWEAVTTGVVVVTLLFYAGMRLKVGVFEKKLEAAGREYQSLLAQFNEYQMKILMDGARQRSPHWQEVLKELSHVVGDRMYLVELSAQDDKLSLKGVITGGEDAEVILSQFMLTLEKGLFKNVKLVTSRKKAIEATEGRYAEPAVIAKPGESGSSEFEIVCEAE
jgi:type IV pilus assembly protein PilM